MFSYPTAHDRDLQQATIDLVMDQIHKGFCPQWMLSYHYGNPYERGWRVVENATRWGYRIPGNRMLWDNVGYDQSLLARRNNPILISLDDQHVNNLLLRHGWGIASNLRQHKRGSIPILSLHERGRLQTQYHTHKLIPALPDALNSIEGIHRLWRQEILPRAKCLSRANSLHVEPVTSVVGLMGYLTKEVREHEINVDYIASHLITPH